MESRRNSELRRTFRISSAEGMFAQFYTTLAGTGSVFITKFALELGAGPLHLGFLAAMGQVFLLVQPVGYFLTRRWTSRKPVVLRLFAAGRMLAVPFGLLPFVLPEHLALWCFILLFFVSVSLQAMGTNAWTGWISDMVPLRVRGRFLSVRSQFLMMGGISSGYILGAFLDLFDSDPKFPGSFIKPLVDAGGIFDPTRLPQAFFLIFLVAAAMGAVSLYILRGQPERPKEREKESIRDTFAAPLKDRNFRRLLLYGTWWMFAVGIGGPFWQPFMIEKLSLSIVEIQIYGTISAFATVLTLRWWGRLVDRFGNKPALGFAMLLAGLNPMLWILADSNGYTIIFFEAASAGFSWAGSGVISTNFVLSIAPKDKRQVYSGIYAAFSGMGIILSLLLSGILLPSPLILLGRPLEAEQVLFGLTGVARWSALIPLALIVEPAAKPIGQIWGYYRHFAKVRLFQLVMWAFTRNGRRNNL